MVKRSPLRKEKEMSTRLEKIKGCLRLARNNDNLNEAQAAMQMAQRLALKEGVDLNDLEAEEVKEDKVTHWIVPQKTKTVPTWRALLATVIAENFRVKAVKLSSGDTSCIEIIGTKPDIEVWKVMFDYAESCLDIFFKRYLEEKKKEGTVMNRHDSLLTRNSYVEGFLSGIAKALSENVQTYALALTLPAVVQSELEGMNIKSSRANKPQKDLSDHESLIRGYQDGEAAGNRNRLEGGEQ